MKFSSMLCSRRGLFFLLLSILAGGCSREDILREDAAGQCLVDISFSVSGFDTKSSISYSDDIHTLSIGFYYEGHLEFSGRYSDLSEDIRVRLIIGHRYEVYTVANAVDFIMPEEESGLSDAEVTWNGTAALSEEGIPMASHISFIPSRGEALNIPMKRLVARCDIIITQTSGCTFRVTDAGIRQSMAYVFPFSEGTPCDSTAQESDREHFDADVSSLTFYMFENLRGTLLPDNTDPWQKVPSNIPDCQNLCTYIEITGEYTPDGGETSHVTYRFFPGEDATTNFDIRRNTLYTIHLCITGEGFGKDSWKISVTD